MRKPFVHALVGLAIAAVVAACGSSTTGTKAASAPSTTTTPQFPVIVRGVTLSQRPLHVVSMSPTATETLFAIGAGTQVIAVDKNSNYPSSAPKGDLDAYNPSVEAVAAKSPDLVVVSDDTKGFVKGLQALKIPVLVETAPTDIDGMYTEITELGTATGHTDGAAKVVADMKSGIQQAVATTKAAGVSYYYELDSTLYSQTSRTFLGKVLGTIGLVNIADAAKGTSDYPQLSAEYVIKANPDLVLLADTKCCQQSEATVAARPGWSTMKAVSGHHVVTLDDDVASRWGPRIVDLLRTVAAAATKVKAGG